MVNRHFSLGCHACRKKHTRCDETKPQCNKCTSKGKECPGYRDTNGFLFVDQAAKSRSRRRKKSTAINDPSSDEDAASKLTIVKSVHPDPGHVSVTFFFNSYILKGRNPSTSRGHFDFLLPLYSQAHPSSLLALAMEVAAGRSMASHYCRSVDSIWHAESLVKASEAMRSAISDPRECLSDGTLLAVLLLDFAEYIKSRRLRTAPSHVHQNAATGLVRLRGAQNFESDVSRSLLHATRSNSLHRAMQGCGNENMDMALLAYMTTDSETVNPALQLDGMIAYTMRLGMRLTNAMKASAGHFVVDIESQLQHCREKLSAWHDALPHDWYPTSYTIAHPPTGFGVMGPYPKETYSFETFGTLDVALIYNQWRCTRLLVIKLLRLCRRAPFRDTLDLEADEVTRDVWRSVPYFVHGPKLSVLAQESLDLTSKGIQELQYEEPSGLGVWYLGQILDWTIPLLDGEGGTESSGANAAAFDGLWEALHTKMNTEMVSMRSRAV